ncbi:MAG: TRAP transporter small permease, partial [Planctomycetaceae bacterium]|nr:TRAP transporter small permease [Planctomycetaceae bacterium]
IPQKPDIVSEISDKPIDSLKISDWSLILLFAVILILMIVSIFYRYVLNNSLSWSDEAIRFAFVWFTFLGSAIVFRENAHIRIDYFLEKMPSVLRLRVETAGYFMTVLFYIFIFVAGIFWVFQTQGTQMSSMRFPLNWFFYSALPITSIIPLYDAFVAKQPNNTRNQ